MGICDENTGKCQCMLGYSSSNGSLTSPGERYLFICCLFTVIVLWLLEETVLSSTDFTPSHTINPAIPFSDLKVLQLLKKVSFWVLRESFNSHPFSVNMFLLYSL
jgi:hypothetical protein